MGIRDKQTLIEDIVTAFQPAISFDGCHKIYILLDKKTIRQQKSYGYGEGGSFLLPYTNTKDMVATLNKWYEDSCGLRFISAVKSVTGNPNDGFISIVSQFEDEKDD